MNFKELRVGNLVEAFEKVIAVTAQDIYDLSQGMDSEIMQPIRLTEEWFEKFGFYTDEIEWFNGVIVIGIYKDGLYYCPTDDISIRKGFALQYVHQLQNLYWCLYGEELILKL